MEGAAKSSLEKTLQSALNSTSHHSSKQKRSNLGLNGHEIQTQTEITWLEDGRVQLYSTLKGIHSPKEHGNYAMLLDDDFIAATANEIQESGGNHDLSHHSTLQVTSKNKGLRAMFNDTRPMTGHYIQRDHDGKPISQLDPNKLNSTGTLKQMISTPSVGRQISNNSGGIGKHPSRSGG